LKKKHFLEKKNQVREHNKRKKNEGEIQKGNLKSTKVRGGAGVEDCVSQNKGSN